MPRRLVMPKSEYGDHVRHMISDRVDRHVNIDAVVPVPVWFLPEMPATLEFVAETQRAAQARVDVRVGALHFHAEAEAVVPREV